MTEEMTWEAPPTRHQYDWEAIASKLKARRRRYPNDSSKWWLKVFDYDRNSIAVQIRANGVPALRVDDGFEVRTSNNVRNEGEPRMCTMYLRFNPE